MPYEVSIQKCATYSGDEVRRAVEGSILLLGGMERFVKKGERILLKPNLLMAKPASSAVTTHPSVVRALIRLVKEAGGTPVVGDSPGMGSAVKAAEGCGIMDVVREESCEFMDLKTAVIAENPGGKTFRRFEIAKELHSVDGVINMPKLKTHAQMFLTLGVKNTFGCVPGMRKAQWHLSAGTDSSHFAGMLIDLHLHVNPRLTVLDAVVSMEGNGPASGTARNTGFVCASKDAFALDIAATCAVGAKPSDVPTIKKAVESGLGPSGISEINILGERLEAIKAAGFKFPPLIHTNFTASLPPFLDKHLRKALTARPHIDNGKCALCGVCVRACPAEKISGKDKLAIDFDGCIRCYCCQEMCPYGAISVKQGWLKKIIPWL